MYLQHAQVELDCACTRLSVEDSSILPCLKLPTVAGLNCLLSCKKTVSTPAETRNPLQTRSTVVLDGMSVSSASVLVGFPELVLEFRL